MGLWNKAAAEAPPKVPRWGRLSELEEYRQIWRSRLEHLVPVREPLVLISQIKRSGGNMLNQLFDGHPECHAHPSELEIGHPTRADWPQLDLAAGSERWFEVLWEKNVREHLLGGYRKSGLGNEAERFAFLFSPRLQRAIFEHCVTSRPPVREREVLDSYFTAYF